MEKQSTNKVELNTIKTIIPPAGDLKLNWVCYEYCGCEIHKHDDFDNLTNQKILEFPNLSRGDLKVGDKVICPTLCGFALAIVKEVSGDTGYAESLSGNFGFSLEFGKDDRNTWVCGCQINLKGVNF